MSECRECIWYGKCNTTANCEDFTPVECDIDAALEVLRQDYRSAFAEYTNEPTDDRHLLSHINTII